MLLTTIKHVLMCQHVLNSSKVQKHFAAILKTVVRGPVAPVDCHCEEPSDVAIPAS